MSISYNPMSESWEDDEDNTFSVGMTMEYGDDILEREFATQIEFWDWYNL